MSLKNILDILKSDKPPVCTAVIAAAGSSARCEGEDKLFYKVNDKPVLAYTLEKFNKCKLISDIIIVTHKDKLELIGEICIKYRIKKVSLILKGGDTRLESVLTGVFAVSKNTTHIAIHDGARPCIDLDIIENTIETALKFNAAAPAVAITSTVKKVTDGIIEETVSRDGLYEIQTPQIFRAEIIKAALTDVKKKSIVITDDCMAVERLGQPVRITEGSRRNIKITVIEDLKLAEAFLTGES